MDKQCLDCHQVLHGRADKKFCDDQCRNNYNNRLKAEDQGPIRKINRILAKNRNILKTCNPNGKTKIGRSVLSKMGFDFDYHTHRYTTTTGNTYVFCYDHGYLALANNELLLIKKD